VCGDLDGAIAAFGKLMVGKGLGEQVRLKRLLLQAYDVHSSFFALLAKLISTHPHLTDRYLNLIAFARYRYPAEFARYMAKYDNATVARIEMILPDIFPKHAIYEGREEAVGLRVSQNTTRIANLLGVAGIVAGKQYIIHRPAFHIGANASNDLVVSGDDLVSGEHAVVRTSANEMRLFDTRSTNGTQLNGQSVPESGVTFSPGDTIQIGTCRFKVLR
jgi:hypothetical protein